MSFYLKGRSDMKKNHSIGLLEARMNRLERNKKANHNICRKIRREIRQMKREGAAFLYPIKRSDSA